MGGPGGRPVGRFRSLVRVPPACSYSLLSGPYCASTAESMRLFLSRREFSDASRLFCISSSPRQLFVVGIEAGAERCDFLLEGRQRKRRAKVWSRSDCFETRKTLPGHVEYRGSSSASCHVIYLLGCKGSVRTRGARRTWRSIFPFERKTIPFFRFSNAGQGVTKVALVEGKGTLTRMKVALVASKVALTPSRGTLVRRKSGAVVR